MIVWAIGVWSGFKLGEVKEFETLLEKPEDAAILREIIESYKKETVEKSLRQA